MERERKSLKDLLELSEADMEKIKKDGIAICKVLGDPRAGEDVNVKLMTLAGTTATYASQTADLDTFMLRFNFLVKYLLENEALGMAEEETTNNV